jgi:uncharacterized protein DUF4349
VLSVPSPEFEAALDELGGLGEEVTTDSVRGEDVTEELVDLQARERNLFWRRSRASCSCTTASRTWRTRS